MIGYLKSILQLVLYIQRNWQQIISHDQSSQPPEIALQKWQQKYQNLLENTFEMIAIFDSELRHLHANPIFTQMTGIPTKVCVGKTYRELGMPETMVNIWEKAVQKLLATGEKQLIEFEVETINGVRAFEMAIAPELTNENTIESILCISQDITERKKAEQLLQQQAQQQATCNQMQQEIIALQQLQQELEQRDQKRNQQLQQAEAKFERIFQTSPYPIAITSLRDRRFIEVNNSFCQVFGYSREQLINNNIDEFTFFANRADQGIVYQHMLADGVVRNLECVIKTKTGEPQTVITSAAFINVDNVPCVLITGNNITERRKIEEQIRISLKEKEILLREVYHRVKNNMQMVSSLLSLQASQVEDPTVLKLLNESQRRVKTMALIHERLYRSENLAQINFATYVPELVNNLMQLYIDANDKIHVTLDVSDLELDLDTAVPCGLIINELVSNALKYAFPQHTGEITLRFFLDEFGYYCLIVKDNGIGIPADFDPQSTTSLGMQLIYGLSAQIGGEIQLDRQGGSEFKILFPKRL